MGPPGAIEAVRFGRYRLLHKLAAGGMAELYLACEDSPHGGTRLVTIKRIRSQRQGDLDYVEFFLAEGRVSLRCRHPNLPHVYELGCVDGSHYLAMEYIEGHTLQRALHGCRQRGLSLHNALHVAIAVAAALEHAHGLRDVDGLPLAVVHRDVTPQNIMVTSGGTIKLIDFGIVRTRLQTHSTQVGVIKGKFPYVAPEVFDRERRIDQRADLFSLGVVLHEMLVGRPLFGERNDGGTIRRVRSASIPPPGGLNPLVPAPLSALTMKALARDPDERFQSATEMLQALEEVAAECRLVPSIVALRDEVAALCAPRPALRASRPPLRGGEESLTGGPTVPLRGPRSRDPELQYFLELAGSFGGALDPLPAATPPAGRPAMDR